MEQVQHTAFNITDIFNLDVNRVASSELIWVANKSNRDWDVFRLTSGNFKIATVRTVNSATQLEIVFTGSHGLSAGTKTTEADYFAISNSEEETLNGVYQVASIVDHRTLLIDYSGNTSFIPALEDGSTADTYGNIYKLISVRFNSMDNVNDRLNYAEYRDKDNSIELQGDKVFADADSSGLWRVYEKQDPYTLKQILSPDSATASQDFGHKVVARNDGRTVVASAPGKGQGEVHFLFRSIASAGALFRPNSTVTTTVGNDNTSKLGESLSMSTCLLYTSPSPRDLSTSRMPSSA